MNTSPSIDQMLEGVLISISTDIIPNLLNPKAHASAQMMQSVIQGVRQLLRCTTSTWPKSTTR